MTLIWLLLIKGLRSKFNFGIWTHLLNRRGT